MAGNLFENIRVAVPMPPTSINNSNATGRYISFNRVRRLFAVLSCGAMAATKTTKLELMQATDEAASGAEAISTYTATITANTKVKAVTVALASVGTGDKVKVSVYKNGTLLNEETFTKASSTDAAKAEFADAAGLETCVLTLAGVTAADNSTNVTITALDGHTITVVSTDVGGTVTVATTAAEVAVEIDEENVDTDESFCFIAPKVTSTANGYNTVTFIMEMKDRPVSTGNIGARYPA